MHVEPQRVVNGNAAKTARVGAAVRPAHANATPGVEGVAARLKVQDRTVRDWILRGQLQAYKIGKEWRIRRDHFDEAIEARRVTTEPTSIGGLWDPDAAA